MKSTIKFNKLFSTSSIGLAIALSTTSAAYAMHNNTYVGVDAVLNSMKFKQDFGGNIFSKKLAPGLNFSVGHMFHENFGAEVGVEFVKKMKRTQRVDSGNKAVGLTVPILQVFETYETKVKQRSPYVGIVAKHNMFNNTCASLMLAGALHKINANVNLIEDGTPNANPLTPVTSSFSKTKLIPTIRLAIEHKLNTNFNIKALLSWKNTGSMGTINVKNVSDSAFTEWKIKPKNSFNFGIGISYII